MAGTAAGAAKARELRRLKLASGQKIDTSPRLGRVPPATVEAARAADSDRIILEETFRVGNHSYGPGPVRAEPGVVATLREMATRRRELRLDPRTGLPEPPIGPPNHVRPIVALTGASQGKPLNPWEAEWYAGQIAETFEQMFQRERRPEPGPCGCCWPSPWCRLIGR